MRAAFLSLISERRRETLRRRGPALLLALVAHVLIVGALLTLAPQFAPVRPSGDGRMAAINLTPLAKPKPKPTRKREEQKTPPSRTAERIDAPPTVVPVPTGANLNILNIDLASSDISKIPSYRPQQAASAGDSAPAAGQGPHGETLYNADWQVEPTQAQLATYMPAGRTGWGLVACRTIARFRVDDCVALDESPPGSGFADAVVQAAWQFRVLPPRIGGKSMVGEWVRIRISIGEGR